MTPLQRRVFQLIWVGLFIATCIYGVIDYVVIGHLVHVQTFEQELRSPLVLALYGGAAAAFLAGSALKATRRQNVFTARLALFEACAVFGLLAAFLTNDWRLFLPTWALAALGFVQTLPPSAEYTPGP
jgi:hypothetical protein